MPAPPIGRQPPASSSRAKAKARARLPPTSLPRPATNRSMRWRHPSPRPDGTRATPPNGRQAAAKPRIPSACAAMPTKPAAPPAAARTPNGSDRTLAMPVGVVGVLDRALLLRPPRLRVVDRVVAGLVGAALAFEL